MVGLKEMARLDAERARPAWLPTLLETSFFEACPDHPASEGRRANRRTIGCNFFCTHCAGPALCSHCLSNHDGHGIIQIRRSSGNNAVKVGDIQHLLDVSLVHTYLYNGEYIVFLNRRPMSGQGKHGSASHCEECQRGLQDEACHFCSLGCKAKGIEDGLDFNVSFAVDLNNDRSGDDAESDDDKDSCCPSELQKLGTISASSSKPVATSGQHCK